MKSERSIFMKNLTKVLFFDTETLGLYGPNRLVQLKWQGSSDVMIFDRDVESAKRVLQQAETIVVHNAFYDFNCPEFIGFDFDGKIFDTRLACIYDRPCAVKFDLDSCLKRYGLGGKGEEGASDWSGELTEEQLYYAEQDVVLLEKLYDKVKHVMKLPAFRLDMHNYKYAVKYSHNGFPVREDRRQMFIKKYAIEETEIKAKLPDDLNVNSPKQVRELLGVGESDKEALTKLSSKDIRAKHILELRDIQKKLSTLRNKFNYDRIKGLFKPAQAKSGRWTCSKKGSKTGQYQNLQQIDRSLKTVFGFDDDNDLYIVDADYSSLEMYTAGAVFNSTKMLQLLYEGRDLHTYTASQTLGVPESLVTKDQRQMAKGLNFGTLYGAGVEVVSLFIHTYTGKKMPIEKVKAARDKWLKTFSDIKAYHNKIGRQFEGKQQMIVRTPLGRPICAKSYTEAINTPAQGFGAETTKTALYLLNKRMPNAKIINTVHDSITLEVKGFEEAKYAACILKDCLDESWEIVKKFIKTDNPVLKKLHMDNIATVHKIYEGKILWTTEF